MVARFFTFLGCALLLFTLVQGHDFESTPTVETSIAQARLLVANQAVGMTVQSFRSARTVPTNPDPSHIKISNSGKVTITPYGLGSTPAPDTANLEWALNHYSDIKLEQGTFHLDRTIEVVNFQGKIKGAGKTKTFIVGRGPLNGTNYVFPYLTADLSERVYPSGVPHLIWFHTDKFTDPNDWVDNRIDLDLKDLTIRQDGIGPAISLLTQPLRSVWALLVISGSNASYSVAGGNVASVAVSIKDVDFSAQYVPYLKDDDLVSAANAAVGVLVYGGEQWGTERDDLSGWYEIDHSPVNAQLTIKDCSFTNFHQFAWGVEGLTTNNPGGVHIYPTDPVFPRSSVDAKNNNYINCGNGGNLIGTGGYTNLILASSDTDIKIADNQFLNNPAIGIAILSGIAEAPTLNKISFPIQIKDNYFQQVGGTYSSSAIILIDVSAFSTGGPDVTIADNEFHGENGYVQFQIMSAMGKNMVVKDNLFSGTSLGAIAISPANIFDPSGPPMPSVNMLIKDNDLDDLTAYGPAKIFIGSGANYNTIYVDSLNDVLDVNGASSTNTIIVQ